MQFSDVQCWISKVCNVKIIEDLIVRYLLLHRGAKELYGAAPRGSLERKSQDLLKDLGMDGQLEWLA